MVLTMPPPPVPSPSAWPLAESGAMMLLIAKVVHSPAMSVCIFAAVSLGAPYLSKPSMKSATIVFPYVNVALKANPMFAKVLSAVTWPVSLKTSPAAKATADEKVTVIVPS